MELRPRQPWEAVDLGCAMVRRDFGRLLLLWVCTVFPVWVVICALMRVAPEWIPLVVWWLKPLYDRVPLHFLSRAAFGVRPGFAETWKAWPRLWMANLFPALLWRRLSFIRTFALPAQMLEGLRGQAANQRVHTLAIDGGGSGFMLTYAFLKIESVAVLGLMWGTYGLLPESMQPDIAGMIEAMDFESGFSSGFYWWVALCYMAVVTLVEPFFVGAGFALYLNCRTRIEGWDVELAFRRMASRLTTAAALILAFALLSGPVLAAPGDAAEAKIQEVLKRPEFEIHKIKTRRWVPEDDPEEEKRKKKKPKRESGDSILDGFFNGMGLSTEFVLYGLVACVVGGVIVYLVKNRHLFFYRGGKDDSHAPKVVMGMNIARESLPQDIVEAARAAWAAGELKEALSLLYRGSLSWVVTRRLVPIKDSDTEEDCLVHVLASGHPAEGDYFRQLTGAWVQVAYALLPVSDAEMSALCDQWPFIEKGGET
ncbi:MAG: DUF4129 domain-containing protein [Prosthecobacter sp.]